MSDYSIFVSLFIFFGLYGITTTANDTSYKDSSEGNVNDTDIFNVSVHYPSFECGYHLPQSLSMLSKSLSLPIIKDCTEVKYINNDVMFYQSQQCVKIIDENQLNIEAENKLLEKLEQILKFIKMFNAAFSNCTQVFKWNTSALSGYYTMRAPNGSLISIFCDFSFLNCSQILHVYSSAPSGYYTIQAPNGSLISAYCDMEGSNCDGKGGWMRVAYLNMSEPGATCPPELTLHQYNNIDHGLCGQPTSLSGNQTSVFFSTYGVAYNKVRGQVIGYQYCSPDGFPPNLGGGVIVNNPNIDNIYVDGVSITYGSNPRKHIWTLGVGLVASAVQEFCCPCNTGIIETFVPSFVGNDYYCESGINSGGWSTGVLYANDSLWDGQQCGGLEGTCCTNAKMPWFIKTFTETTTEDIELRVMVNENTNNEDIPLDVIELYIH